MTYINYSDFLKVDISVGTILKAEKNNKLNNPSIILVINFGEKIAPSNYVFPQKFRNYFSKIKTQQI